MDLTLVGKHNPLLRDYRKGNWNLQETTILIHAKRMDDERRTRRPGEAADRGKPAELRWKWVEDYCWRNGCFRSQNQCNDKWDNLMRDFKKIRDYETRIAPPPASDGFAGPGESKSSKSYWRIEKTERKDNNLPSNMLPEIYDALAEVAERKGRKALIPGAQHALMPSPVRQVHPAEIPGGVGGGPAAFQPLPTVDTSDTSDCSGSRRRKRRGDETMRELGLEITKGAATIAAAIRSGEERRERRHEEVVRLQERRLRSEESKAEMNGVVDAINMLANSIYALAAHNNNRSPSK